MLVVKADDATVELIQGDITEADVDAIVNAANKELKLGGGVAGAIRRRGGPRIQEECDKIGGTYVGGAVITTGGNLKAKYVIHAVGPVYGEPNGDLKLKDATLNSLRLAEEHKLKSIAFPAVSTGVFSFPIDRCARIMLRTVREFLKSPRSVRRIAFYLFDKEAYRKFGEECKRTRQEDDA